jgi:hypothetical protein
MPVFQINVTVTVTVRRGTVAVDRSIRPALLQAVDDSGQIIQIDVPVTVRVAVATNAGPATRMVNATAQIGSRVIRAANIDGAWVFVVTLAIIRHVLAPKRGVARIVCTLDVVDADARSESTARLRIAVVEGADLPVVAKLMNRVVTTEFSVATVDRATDPVVLARNSDRRARAVDARVRGTGVVVVTILIGRAAARNGSMHTPRRIGPGCAWGA